MREGESAGLDKYKIPASNTNIPSSATHITRVGGHDSEVVIVDNLLHLLHAAEIAEHVADGDDILVLHKVGRDQLDLVYRRRRDGFLDEIAHGREVLEEVEL